MCRRIAHLEIDRLPTRDLEAIAAHSEESSKNAFQHHVSLLRYLERRQDVRPESFNKLALITTDLMELQFVQAELLVFSKPGNMAA